MAFDNIDIACFDYQQCLVTSGSYDLLFHFRCIFYFSQVNIVFPTFLIIPGVSLVNLMSNEVIYVW